MIIREMDIDMCAGGHSPILRVSRGDSDFGIVLHLYNSSGTFTLESGTTAKLCGKKPDGSEFETVASISGMDVIVAGTSALTNVQGKGELEVCLTKGGKSIYSQNFTIYIEKEANGGQTT